VGEDGFDEARDVVRDDELAAVEGGPHLRGANELERRAGARAEAQIRVLARRAGERDGVLLDGGRDVHAPRPGDETAHAGGVDDRSDRVERVHASRWRSMRLRSRHPGSPSRCAS
jgi:hypothetical protein